MATRALGWGWMFFSFLVLTHIFAFCARCCMLETNFVKKRSPDDACLEAINFFTFAALERKQVFNFQGLFTVVA